MDQSKGDIGQREQSSARVNAGSTVAARCPGCNFNPASQSATRLCKACLDNMQRWAEIAKERAAPLMPSGPLTPIEEYQQSEKVRAQSQGKAWSPLSVVEEKEQVVFEFVEKERVIEEFDGARSEVLPECAGIEQIPFDSLCDEGQVFAEGIEKYSEGAWRKGIFNRKWKIQRWAHALRHLWRWLYYGNEPENNLAKVAWFCHTMREIERMEARHKAGDTSKVTIVGE